MLIIIVSKYIKDEQQIDKIEMGGLMHNNDHNKSIKVLSRRDFFNGLIINDSVSFRMMVNGGL